MRFVVKLAVGAAIALAGGIAGPANAGALRYASVGTPNPVTYSFTATATGDIVAYFAGSGASFSEQLGMLVNGVQTSAGFGLNDHVSSIGQSFDLGHANAGDVLVFVLNVSTPNFGNVYSDPTMNTKYDTDGSKGHNHIYSTAYNGGNADLVGVPAGTYVGFEDVKFPNADFNYYDETYVFTNVATTASIPEPGSLGLMGVGLLGLGLLRRKRCRHP